MALKSRIQSTIAVAALSVSVLVSGFFSSPSSAYAAASIEVGGKALIANTDGDNIRVRDAAGITNKQVAEAHEGETVSVLAGPSKDAKGISWYKIDGPGGTGWIAAGFLTSKSAANKALGASSSKAGAQATTAGSPATKAAVSSKSVAPSTNAKSTASEKAAAPVSAPAARPAAPKIVGFASVAHTDGDPLRIRDRASTSSSVLTNLAPGASVAIKQGPLTDSDGTVWYQISASGVTGWAMGQYLAQAKGPDAAVTAPMAEQKPAPSVAAPAIVAKPVAPVTQAPAVPQVAVAAPPAAQPASQVDTARTGTARGTDQPSAPASRRGSIVGTAMRYVGYRYRFGGTSPSGFDCSGFLYYVLNRAGVSVGRNMYSQLASGPRVRSSELRPGDLLFFSNTYKRGLSHAGIYIGNGRFVHAENESTGVSVSELWSSYWAAHYTTAVRPTP